MTTDNTSCAASPYYATNYFNLTGISDETKFTNLTYVGFTSDGFVVDQPICLDDSQYFCTVNP
jgi:hypothetical protein